MKVQLGSIYKTKDERHSDHIICPIENYSIDKYLNRRLLIRTTFWCIFAFGLGYKLYWEGKSVSNIVDLICKFLSIYILSFYLMQIPHEFMHLIFFPKTFTDKNIEIKFFNHKRLVTCISHSPISSIRLSFILMLPFILFTGIPAIYILSGYFNIYIYGFTVANAILAADDLLNIFLQFFVVSENNQKFLYELSNNSDNLINNESSNEKVDIINTET